MKVDFSDVYGVVVTYQRYPELKKTLQALNSEGIGWSKLIIIDNNPSSSRDFALIAEYMQCKWIFPAENIASAGGFALGMEEGIRLGADWVWLFNDDSRPISGALDSLKNAISQSMDKKIGMVKIANFNDKGEAILLDWKGVRKPRYVKPSSDPFQTDLVTFDGCLISAELIKQIGYCDPAYFMGTYEFDYCLRARDAEFAIFTIPNGLIEDGKLGSVGGTPPWRQYYNTRNHLWLGIDRGDPQTKMAWLVREIKFIYAILRWEDQKILRLKMKFFATVHALMGKRGKVYSGEKRNL
ncbi:glycosyltransferase family 2 protein [Algoriphagus jejuensis]|uniref:Glycosyltransferase family 2 protein n=1 Tax=Algoriphagus jejuensis TaxID=419934 RepID=A0ABN1N4M2_9BACT